MSKDKELKEHIDQLQPIDKVGDYTLYYNTETDSISIYNGEDMHSANIEKLGKAVFGEEE